MGGGRTQPKHHSGFVAVANVLTKQPAGDSFLEWMARKARLEKEICSVRASKSRASLRTPKNVSAS